MSGVAVRRLMPVAVALGALALAGAAAFAGAIHLAGTGTASRAVPLLLALGGGALGLALALAVTAWVFARGLAAGHRTAAGSALLPRSRRRLRFAVIGPVLLLAVLGIFGLRWYRYVTNAETPFDEVGIDLNARVPEPLRRWGCGRLEASFGAGTPPPRGCGAPGDPRRWR